MSVQVLDAVARTLGLDAAEQAYLYRLAGVPCAPSGVLPAGLPPGVPAILAQLAPHPAVLLDSKFEVLACNDAYRIVFPDFGEVGRNVLRAVVVLPECCNPYRRNDDELRRMVAYLRGAYVEHLDDRRWRALVDELCGASAVFAQFWAGNDVASAGDLVKVVRHPAVGELAMNLTVMALPATDGAWLQVFTPADADAVGRVERLAAMPEDERLAAVIEHRTQCSAVC